MSRRDEQQQRRRHLRQQPWVSDALRALGCSPDADRPPTRRPRAGRSAPREPWPDLCHHMYLHVSFMGLAQDRQAAGLADSCPFVDGSPGRSERLLVVVAAPVLIPRHHYEHDQRDQELQPTQPHPPRFEGSSFAANWRSPAKRFRPRSTPRRVWLSAAPRCSIGSAARLAFSGASFRVRCGRGSFRRENRTSHSSVALLPTPRALLGDLAQRDVGAVLDADLSALEDVSLGQKANGVD
jgi:hypothetical protein